MQELVVVLLMIAVAAVLLLPKKTSGEVARAVTGPALAAQAQVFEMMQKASIREVDL